MIDAPGRRSNRLNAVVARISSPSGKSLAFDNQQPAEKGECVPHKLRNFQRGRSGASRLTSSAASGTAHATQPPQMQALRALDPASAPRSGHDQVRAHARPPATFTPKRRGDPDLFDLPSGCGDGLRGTRRGGGDVGG